MPQCKAKSKRSGKRCRANAMPNGVCYHHGGKSLAGESSPQYITGRWSKYAPRHMAEDYHRGRTDPDLLQLDDDIAVMDLRIGELFGDLDQPGASAAMWARLKKLAKQLRVMMARGNEAEAMAVLMQMEQVAAEGAGDGERWDEIFDRFEGRRRMVETQRKTMLELGLMYTAAQGLLMISILEDSIKKYVTDSNTIEAIATDFDQQFGLKFKPTVDQEHETTGRD